MKQILISRITVGDRVRELDQEHVQQLKADIREKGLLQAIVLTRDAVPTALVAGEHRMAAITELHAEGIPVIHDETPIHPGCIPYVTVGELTPEQMLDYEIAENIVRKELAWQDRANAIAKLHRDMGELTTERQPSVAATAKALASGGDKRSEAAIRRDINRSEVISQHLSNPEVAKAKSSGEAWTIIQKQTRDLIGRLRQNYPLSSSDEQGIPYSPHTLIRGPFQEHRDALRDQRFDLILCDPPYGTEADKWTTKFKSAPHAYNDSFEHALATYSAISRMGMEWTADRANLFMFCVPQYWHLLYKLVEKDGWAPWARPIVWKKSNEGIRPHGTAGFAYTYETILYATKGGKGLLKSISDVIEVYKVSNAERIHGAQKPVELYQILIDISCYPGDKVCDPTAGSGTIFEAAHLTGTIATGCENDPASQELCQDRIDNLLNNPIDEEQMDLEDL